MKQGMEHVAEAAASKTTQTPPVRVAVTGAAGQICYSFRKGSLGRHACAYRLTWHV